jgi:hypothetical protein
MARQTVRIGPAENAASLLATGPVCRQSAGGSDSLQPGTASCRAARASTLRTTLSCWLPAIILAVRAEPRPGNGVQSGNGAATVRERWILCADRSLYSRPLGRHRSPRVCCRAELPRGSSRLQRLKQGGTRYRRSVESQFRIGSRYIHRSLTVAAPFRGGVN